jgi:lipopolysaccharide/colanic/teichoic acid biosynthesis glycosyltransferase
MIELTKNELARPMNATSYTEDIFVSSWCASWQKHCFDVALAVVLLVLSSPVQLAICIVLRFFYRVPVFFRQVRTGRNGRPFVIYKYRTMEEGQDCHCSLVTRADDPRITRFGGVLRRTKLDEFPQLINILRGEMSFVGPRPRVPTQESSLFMTRPGLTGIASLILAHEEKILQQVPEEAQEQYHAQVLNPLKLRYDLQYVEAASLSLDIEIMVRTAIKVYFSPLRAEIDLQSVPLKTMAKHHMQSHQATHDVSETAV